MWRRAGSRSMRDWTPTCRGCGYDVRGLPDGACPECGRTFTLVALRMAAEMEADTRRSDWASRARIAAVVFSVALLLSFGQLHPSQIIHAARRAEWIQPIDAGSEVVLIAVAWIAGLAWMAMAKTSGRPSHAILLWLPPLTLRTLLGASLLSGWDRLLVAPWLIVGAWLVVRLPRMDRRRVTDVMCALLAVCSMLVGIVMLLALPQSPGSTWSIWRDPRPGQEYDQFPMTVRESHVVGMTAFVLSITMLGALAWRFPRTWLRRNVTRPASATAEQGGAKLADAAASDA